MLIINCSTLSVKSGSRKIRFKMKVFSGLIGLLLLIGGVFPDDDLVRLATVEDHPWVIVNETCLKDTPSENACYKGFLIDLINLISLDLKFNHTIQKFGEFGHEDKSSNPPKWTDAIGAVIDKKVDVVFGLLNITEELKKVVDFTASIFNKPGTNQTLAFAITKGLAIKDSFSHMIKKLINQLHVEQLMETWFNENTDAWQTDKQLTKLY